ncbi:uncharacterized protein Dana_GF20810 [Drosophila ananassae]|uniref:Nucleolar 27S pre-rRNA processing Urb2/Npa2 C-terminal domain-containing protein n=1 Tax=Drosophila ananassae TaxID=7217 RepID=B3MSF1_DROAN|nr:uncharacterized protein LOC6503502 [Drosophila ananassae]EDV34706.2 uncharacterized protein Dana_GF20810 [Drosophila ananassae]
MDTGEELKSWLQEESKPYAARVEFALRVWQSVEFPYSSKFEIIIRWLSESLASCGQLPTQQLKDLFQVRAQPGLVSQECKSALIRALVAVASTDTTGDEAILGLLSSCLSFELLQDALRSDYNLLTEIFACIFRSHQKCVEKRTKSGEDQGLEHTDAEFVIPIIKQLTDMARRSQNVAELLECHDKQSLGPLVELLLTLKSHCVEEFAELEKQLKGMFRPVRIMKQPLHVRLLILEAEVLNNRYDTKLLSKTIKSVFNEREPMLLAAHLLVSLRKYDISLQFDMKKKKAKENPQKSDSEEEEPIDPKAKKVTGFSYISEQLLEVVRNHRKKHLKEVLVLLCSALRLNPLLLEHSVYQITVWLLTAPKQTDLEEQLYSEYLILLLDMFRRLSRAERFIMNLLKSLKEWLAKYQLPGSSGESKKRRLQDSATKAAENEAEQQFLQVIMAESSPATATASSANDAFKQLNHTWPSHSAGVAFTRLVSHLMTKPSLVIWKTLLHSFAELLEEDQTQTVLPENLDFSRDFHAALLCQYLSGTRLAEQVHLHQSEVEQQLQHTSQVLELFGRRLLSQEHNRRLMNAFLECTERASGFELLLAHYWPDGHPASQQSVQLRGFLPPAEWTLIQQRVHNFGKSSCRQRLQRLELQLAESGWLLQADQRGVRCPVALAEIVPASQLFRLTRTQKQQRTQQAMQDLEDAECVELLALQLLQEYAASVKAAKVKGSLLAKLKLEEQLDQAALVTFLREKATTDKEVEELPSALETVKGLQGLPLAQLSSAIRSRLWLVVFVLYRDLSRSQQQQEEQTKEVLDVLIDLMHFGQPLPVCEFIPKLATMLEMIPTASTEGWSFYETLFARCIRRQGAGSESFLVSCAEHLREQLAANSKLSGEQTRLLLLAIQTLSNASGAQGRRLQRHLQPLVEIFGEMVAHKFRSKKKEASVYKEFVDATRAGYATYLSSCINRVAKQEREKEQQLAKSKKAEEKENEGQEEDGDTKKNKKSKKKAKEEKEPEQDLSETIDDKFRRICKIYIGYSLDYRNPHAIRLLNAALTHRQRLHLDPDEIEFVLSSYWRQLNEDIATGDISPSTVEPAIKLIIGYKTNEDFLLLLRRLSAQMEKMPRPDTPVQHTALRNVLTLLGLFAKCSLSSVKGAMLNEHFEVISVSAALRLPEPKDSEYRNHALRLLEAQRHMAGNRTVPLTGETLDCLLGSLLDVDIKHLIRNGGSWTDLVELYGAITDNLMVLLKQHTNLMSDRAAQLSALCQDLVQAIVGYRAERKQAQDLTETELDGLADLGLKLATVMSTVTSTQALAVKRVAPFLLIFTIRQMVATERPTTLFEKVKVHVVRVCHELIGICDHRAGHFILRSSSEAGARMYESLVKDHEKYHKFRGKV